MSEDNAPIGLAGNAEAIALLHQKPLIDAEQPPVPFVSGEGEFVRAVDAADREYETAVLGLLRAIPAETTEETE